jgi:SAM-dependent methyltransferase
LTDFDRYGTHYEELVERSISFGGRGHDFYLRAKAVALLDLVVRRLGDPRQVSAIDVGCGSGALDRELSALGRLEGVDPSEAMVAAARAANPQVEYRVADGTALPHEDAAFDLAFASCVLHHVPLERRADFVGELGRVIRPGGLAVVLEHNPFNPLTRLAVHRCEFDEDAELLPLRETKRRLADAGLRTAEQRYILFVPLEARPVRRLERLLARVPFGAQYYVAATRDRAS